VNYELETDAIVRYPMKLQLIQARQTVALQDRWGDAGVARVQQAVRALSADESAIVRLNDKSNTLDLDEAAKQLEAQAAPIEAVVAVSDYRAAAVFVEKTRDLFAAMIYTEVPDVQGPALGPQLDAEKRIDGPTKMRNLDLGAGTTLNFGRAELQISPGFGEAPLDEPRR
jgi:branched-chain amino acid transport system substrate-binding protein